MLVVRAGWEQKARLLELSLVYSGFVVAELQNLIAHTVMPNGSVTPGRALATMVSAIVQDGVAKGAKVAGLLVHAEPVLELHDELGGRHSQPQGNGGHDSPEILGAILAFRNKSSLVGIGD